MKITILSLILVLFASACSRKSGTGPVQFNVTGRDLASPVEVTTNTLGDTGSVVLHIKLSPTKADELRKLTEHHVNQYMEIVAGSKVIMKGLVHDPISGGEFNVCFGLSDTNAQAVADFLSKK
jgi:preprotein translocase subunit SecD